MKPFWRSSHVEVTSPRWHSLSAWHFQARWISPMPLTHASFLFDPGRIQFVRRKGVCGVRSFGPGLGVWQSSLSINWAVDTHETHNWVTGCLVQMHQKLQLSAPLRLNFEPASTDIPSDQPQENPMNIRQRAQRPVLFTTQHVGSRDMEGMGSIQKARETQFKLKGRNPAGWICGLLVVHVDFEHWTVWKPCAAKHSA